LVLKETIRRDFHDLPQAALRESATGRTQWLIHSGLVLAPDFS